MCMKLNSLGNSKSLNYLLLNIIHKNPLYKEMFSISQKTLFSVEPPFPNALNHIQLYKPWEASLSSVSSWWTGSSWDWPYPCGNNCFPGLKLFLLGSKQIDVILRTLPIFEK